MESKQLHLEIQAIVDQLDKSDITSQLNQRFDRVASLFVSDKTAEDASTTIYKFLIRYVLLTPELMETLNSLSLRYSMQPLIDPYIQLASNYLTSACHELLNDVEADSLKRFMTLLQGAYIFHRMIEELDDRIQNFIGVPLTHHDTMHSNLIAHDIIGDNFANRLDQIVSSLFQQSKITKALIEAQLDRKQVELFRKSGEALSGQQVQCIAEKENLSMIEIHPG